MARKRISGKRTPSGQRSRSKAAILDRGERATAMCQPHRRWLEHHRMADDKSGRDYRADQRAATTIGRLRLAGLIDEAEYLAGARWAAIMHEMHVVIASPCSPRSSSGTMVPSGNEPPAEAHHLSREVEPEEKRQARVFKAYDAVVNKIDRESLTALDVAVVQDLPVNDGRLSVLRGALRWLAALWKIAGNERRAA